MTDDQVLVAAFAAAHPEQVAAMIAADASSATDVLAALTPAAAGRVLRHLPPHSTALLLGRIDPTLAAAISTELGHDLAALCLRASDASVKAAIVARLPAATAVAIERLLAYPANSAGGLMDPSVLTLGEHDTVASALERVRAASARTMYYLYVVGEDAKLRGVVTLRELLQGDGATPVMQLARADPDTLSADAGPQSILSHPAWRRYHTLPVVDRDGRLVGALRHEALRGTEQLVRDVATKDVAGMTSGALAEVFSIALLAVLEWASGSRSVTAAERAP